jgi:hypothetical protein
MRQLLAFFILTFAVGLSLDTFAQSTDVDIAITNETSRADLWDIRNDLAEQGLVFEYHPLFDNQRKLTGLTIKVTNNDGQIMSYEDTTLTDGEVIKIVRTTGEDDVVFFCAGLCGE